uniref:Ubiquinol-cytochrome c chaperone domain-containing protein n=1 Tax=Tetraselmis chuii TaxID=63592 RepID=A0A7S1SSB8_9CHLO
MFQEDVEVRVREAGVKVRISKWLTDLEQRFFGAAMSYDKALEEQDRLKGSEMLVDALWKNVFNAEGDKQAAKLLAKYVRRELTSLAITPSEAVLNGQIRFSRPN